MAFKENLLTKLKIDRLAARVMDSIAAEQGGGKVDKDAMRKLLELSAYQYQRVRDLDLYVQEIDQDQKEIFVLDNEAAHLPDND